MGWTPPPGGRFRRHRRVLAQVGRLAIDLPEIHEPDISPLPADASGVIALDARIGVDLAPRGRVTAA